MTDKDADAEVSERDLTDELGLLVTAGQIADRLNVKLATVHQWRFRAKTSAVPLPDPVWAVNGSPLWRWEDIAEWAKQTGRRP